MPETRNPKPGSPNGDAGMPAAAPGRERGWAALGVTEEGGGRGGGLPPTARDPLAVSPLSAVKVPVATRTSSAGSSRAHSGTLKEPDIAKRALTHPERRPANTGAPQPRVPGARKPAPRTPTANGGAAARRRGRPGRRRPRTSRRVPASRARRRRRAPPAIRPPVGARGSRVRPQPASSRRRRRRRRREQRGRWWRRRRRRGRRRRRHVLLMNGIQGGLFQDGLQLAAHRARHRVSARHVHPTAEATPLALPARPSPHAPSLGHELLNHMEYGCRTDRANTNAEPNKQ
jgi:hypothetical protein